LLGIVRTVRECIYDARLLAPWCEVCVLVVSDLSSAACGFPTITSDAAQTSLTSSARPCFASLTDIRYED
jgi:hypothetical protein